MGKVGDGEYPPVSRAVPDANETRDKWMEEVVGRKTDTTRTAKGTTYSLVAMAKGSLDNEATIIGLLQKDFVAERNEVSWCDVDNTARFEVSLIDNDTGPIDSDDITPGTITISRIRAGVTTVIVNAAAFSKANGKIYYDYTFAAANWATDDGFLAEAAGVSFTIGGSARYPAIPAWFGNIQDTSTIVGKIDTIDGIVDNILAHSVSVLADTAELQTDWTNGGRLDLILDNVLAHGVSILADTDELQGDWVDGGRLDVILDSALAHGVSILADTDELQTDWVNGGRLDLILDDVLAHATSILADSNELQADWTNGGRLDAILDNIQAHSVSILADATSILADTNELQTDWVNGGRLDIILDSVLAHGVSVLADTNELQADWTNGGRLDLIVDDILAHSTSILADAATIMADVIVIDGYHDVPGIDSFNNSQMRDVIGNKVDSTGGDSIVSMLKNNYAILLDVWQEGKSLSRSVVANVGNNNLTFKTNILSSDNDFFNDMQIIFINGDNQYQARRISDYDGTSKFITVDVALHAVPSDADWFIILPRWTPDIMGGLSVIDGLMDVPVEDAATDLYIRDVVGKKSDTVLGTSLVALVKNNALGLSLVKAVTDLIPDAGAMTSIAKEATLGSPVGASISADITAIQSDIGDPSLRTNLKTILALLGNPDTAGMSAWSQLKILNATAIDGSTVPVANTLSDILHKNVSYTFDNATDSLEAIADTVIDINTTLGNHDVDIKAILGTPGFPWNITSILGTPVTDLATDIAAISALIGSPAGFSLCLDVADVKADTDTLITNLNDIHNTDLPAVKTDTGNIKTSTDKLAGEAVVNSSATQNWNAAEADVVSIGTASTKKRVHTLLMSINSMTAAATITFRAYLKINGTERQINWPDGGKTISVVKGTDADGVVAISGEFVIHDALRITAQSNNPLDDGLAIPYTIITEAM